MGVFAKSLFIGSAISILAGLPALAQFYPVPPPAYPPPVYAPRPYEQPYYQPRRAPPGYTCQTRRVACDLESPRPLGSGCNCFIPGYGYRNGQVTP